MQMIILHLEKKRNHGVKKYIFRKQIWEILSGTACG
jgi:hypothetical protein